MIRVLGGLITEIWMLFSSWRALRWAGRWMRAQARAEAARRHYRKWIARAEGRTDTETEGG